MFTPSFCAVYAADVGLLAVPHCLTGAVAVAVAVYLSRDLACLYLLHSPREASVCVFVCMCVCRHVCASTCVCNVVVVVVVAVCVLARLKGVKVIVQQGTRWLPGCACAVRDSCSWGRAGAGAGNARQPVLLLGVSAVACLAACVSAFAAAT